MFVLIMIIFKFDTLTFYNASDNIRYKHIFKTVNKSNIISVLIAE